MNSKIIGCFYIKFEILLLVEKNFRYFNFYKNEIGY